MEIVVFWFTHADWSCMFAPEVLLGKFYGNQTCLNE